MTNRIYRWDPWPIGLYTKKQLSEMGYKPGEVAGLIPYSGSADGDGYLRVYSLIDAQPKKPLSDKQKAALDKAREKWQCPQCGGRKRWRDARICDWCLHQERINSDRADSVGWANIALEHGFVILDTETTGLSFAEIVQIAVIDHQGNVLLDSLCKPLDYPEANEATAIHGITPEMVKDAPDFGYIYEQLYHLLKDKWVIIYNRAFDETVLARCARLYHLPELRMLSVCAMVMYAQFCGDWSEYHHDYRWQPLEGDHTALGDCRATLAVVKEMAQSK